MSTTDLMAFSGSGPPTKEPVPGIGSSSLPSATQTKSLQVERDTITGKKVPAGNKLGF